MPMLRRMFCVMVLILSGGMAALRAEDAPTAYDQAMGLLAQGKRDEGIALLRKIQEGVRSVQMNVSVIVPSSRPADAKGGKPELPIPKRRGPGPEVIALGKSERTRESVAVRATGATVEQVSLLDQSIRGPQLGGGISSFGLKVFDSQLVNISLVPEQSLWTFHPEDKRPRAVGKEMPFTLRPMMGDSGELWIRFSDDPKKDDPFPPVFLTYGLSDAAPSDLTYSRSPALVKVPDSGYLLLWGFQVRQPKDVETGVPVLRDLPLLNTFFSKHSTIMIEWEVFVILKFDAAKQG